MEITSFLTETILWGEQNRSVLGILLVGSHARNAARSDSDVDLVILSNEKDNLISNHAWIETFGISEKILVENFGALTSIRVFYKNDLEIEFGIVSPDWASLNPLDPGTKRVIVDGSRIILDKKNLLKPLLHSIKINLYPYADERLRITKVVNK
jgi:predicted nucleotidyltransferase